MRKENFIEKEYLSADKLIDKSIKTRTVNTIIEKLKELESKTDNSSILNIIGTLKQLAEDAYVVDMYQFTFKLFTKAIQKDIEQIEGLI